MKIDRERGVISFTLATLLFLLAPLAANSAENFAAHITKLDGKAFASRSGGSMRTLRVNDRLYARERVITGRKTSIDLKFTDGTALALGSSTAIRSTRRDIFDVHLTRRGPCSNRTFGETSPV
jgi:hypothetical protein